jgi:hypothetical protein
VLCDSYRIPGREKVQLLRAHNFSVHIFFSYTVSVEVRRGGGEKEEIWYVG